MTGNVAHATTGRLIHSARGYDLVVWLLTLGRERAFRERLLELARVQPGESVLDVGCGTGALAIAAKQRAGAGRVSGIDASPQMIERAREKARKAAVDVDFRVAVVELMPFRDAEFDVVLSTLMLHHLPRAARETCMQEIARVLRPGGRVLAVDFMRDENTRGIIGLMHRHGGLKVDDIVGLVRSAELTRVASGAVGKLGLYYILAANHRTQAS